MTRSEFAGVLAYLSAGLGGKEVSKETAHVLYDALGDLPLEALQIAAKRVLLERVYASLPSAAELRTAALDALTGVSESRAWHLALAFSQQGGLDDWTGGQPKTFQERFNDLPPPVQECVKVIGMRTLANLTQYDKGAVRGQFNKVFAEARGHVPAALRKQIAELPAKALPEAARKAISRIGVENPEPKTKGKR